MAQNHTLASLQARAEATFKARHEQRQQAPLAMREYREAEEAVREKTKRLRELRLARDAELKV